MMNFQHQHMNNYTDINPYQLIYCNMNIRINQQSSKETAQNVVRQIGYLHNAIGYVFKDLIKILSFRYPDNNMHLNNGKSSPYTTRPQVNVPNKQAMDIEFHSQPQLKQPQEKLPKPKLKVNLQQKQKPSVIFEGKQIEEQKPPNTNIFDQYAYSKQIPPQTNKQKDISQIKLARIIEGIKKKKGAELKDSRDKNLKDLALDPKRKNSNEHTFSDKTEKKSLNEANPLNDFLDKQMEVDKQADIFNEFIYKSRPSPISKPVQQIQSAQTNIVQRSQQDESRLWQFLKQKEEPPIYEISDDED